MSLFTSHVRGYLKERMIQVDDTATDEDCQALLIANIDLPSFLNLIDRLIERSQRAYNVGNDGQRPERERNPANKTHVELQDAIERLMALFDVEVDWPGLYPSFKFGRYSFHSPLSVMRDVMAARQPNADRLAKAAPDLLQALELAVATIERLQTVHPGGFSSASGTIEVASAAITKAKGV